MSTRATTLDAIKANPTVPVLICGGGINGIGVFRELALQGVDCLLIDKSDFTAGASSKSSRMIHGGLRYLENREFKLVRESLEERNRLLENAPHYVTPLKTTIPLFSWFGGLIKSPLVFFGLPVKPGGRGVFVVKFGLAFYDFVTRKHRCTPTHYITRKAASSRAVPGLNPAIAATGTYWDACITQAERLCIELIQDARAAHPACRAVNYVRLAAVEGDTVLLEDTRSGETMPVKPGVVVNAAGAWVDGANAALGLETRFMGGTKGSHLVVDNEALTRAVGDQMVYYEHEDGRVCIVFTFMGKVIMGSTDIPIEDPDQAVCAEDEIEYMKETLKGVFPDIIIKREEILYTFCGVRPLPAADVNTPGRVSRDHRIDVAEPDETRTFPVFSLIGGKWTTFRGLAEQTADQVLPRLAVERTTSTVATPIGGGKDYPIGEGAKEVWVDRVAASTGLNTERVAVLLERYGTQAEAYAGSLTRGETPLQTLPAYTVEEISHITTHEFVEHLTDLLCRRTVLALLGEAGPAVIDELAGVVGGVLGWDQARRETEVEQARAEMLI